MFHYINRGINYTCPGRELWVTPETSGACFKPCLDHHVGTESFSKIYTLFNQVKLGK